MTHTLKNGLDMLPGLFRGRMPNSDCCITLWPQLSVMNFYLPVQNRPQLLLSVPSSSNRDRHWVPDMVLFYGMIKQLPGKQVDLINKFMKLGRHCSTPPSNGSDIYKIKVKKTLRIEIIWPTCPWSLQHYLLPPSPCLQFHGKFPTIR